jgi:hypothetical protein
MSERTSWFLLAVATAFLLAAPTLAGPVQVIKIEKPSEFQQLTGGADYGPPAVAFFEGGTEIDGVSVFFPLPGETFQTSLTMGPALQKRGKKGPQKEVDDLLVTIAVRPEDLSKISQVVIQDNSSTTIAILSPGDFVSYPNTGFPNTPSRLPGIGNGGFIRFIGASLSGILIDFNPNLRADPFVLNGQSGVTLLDIFNVTVLGQVGVKLRLDAFGVRGTSYSDGHLVAGKIVASAANSAGAGIHTTPEPGTLVLSMAGLGGLWFLRRRFPRAASRRQPQAEQTLPGNPKRPAGTRQI